MRLRLAIVQLDDWSYTFVDVFGADLVQILASRMAATGPLVIQQPFGEAHLFMNSRARKAIRRPPQTAPPRFGRQARAKAVLDAAQ